MKIPSPEDVIKVLLDSCPESLAHTLGIPVEDASAGSLFRLLRASLLYNDRTTWETLARVEYLMAERNWNEPRNLARSLPDERKMVLEAADYAVFDENEQAVQWLGELARKVKEEYKGDLSLLRERAAQDREQERALLREFPGMGELQADIFQREAQVGWCEAIPFLGSRAESAAGKLGLPEDRVKLMLMAGSLNLPRLAAALDRVAREKSQQEVLLKARQLERV